MSNSTRQCILFVICKKFLGKNNIFYACYYQLLFRVWRTSIVELWILMEETNIINSLQVFFKIDA